MCKNVSILPNLFRLSLASTLLVFASSCAAMFTGTKSDVQFTSNPPGATVRAGDHEGVTPVRLEVSKRVKTVRVSHPDHGERIVTLDRKFQPGFLLMDLLFTPGFGASGVLIDAATSGWFEHPALVEIDLEDPSGRRTGIQSIEPVEDEEAQVSS